MTLRAKLIGGLLAASLVVASAGGIYWNGRHVQAAKDKPVIERAVDKANVSDLSVKGAQESARQVDIVVHQITDAYAVAGRVQIEAKQDEDADAPLPSTRATRLLRSDRELCDVDPSIVGCKPAG